MPRNTRVVRGVLRIAMAEVILHGPEVCAPVGQVVAAGMAKHVGPDAAEPRLLVGTLTMWLTAGRVSWAWAQRRITRAAGLSWKSRTSAPKQQAVISRPRRDGALKRALHVCLQTFPSYE